jgi:predicted CXXCH cytochrome family protein
MRRLPCTGCHQPHSSAKQYLIYKKGELCVHCHKSLY